MKRWVWIAASLAALFGAQGSVCAVACLEAPRAELARHAPAEAMPCHGAPAHSTPEPDVPASHDACGCDATALGVTEDGEAIATSFNMDVSPPSLVPLCAAPVTLARLSPQALERLPPPDTLLLKSTWLL